MRTARHIDLSRRAAQLLTLANQSSSALPLSAIWVVLAGLLGAVLLNAHHTAVWCAPLALGAVAWRLRRGTGGKKLRGQLTRILLVLGLTTAALLTFRSHGSLGAAASLLVVMATLKLSETQQRRDWLIIVSAAVFLLLAACLDAQQLWRLPLYGAELWLLCTALYALGTSAVQPSTWRLFISSARSLAAALPLALLLFLFFPRLTGAFWAWPQQGQATSGLGDEMSPGSITNLVQSDEPALRVRFDAITPPVPSQRYWRGPVLHDFDGFTWRRWHIESAAAPRLQYSGPGYGYQVTLEPNEHNVLIALELPQGLPNSVPFVMRSFDDELLTPRPLMRTTNYHLVSYPRHRSLEQLPPAQRRLDLQLPRARNPRTLELAQRLRSGVDNDEAYEHAALDYLRRGNFRYSLTPAPLGADSVDDLLFRTREGFCGHYASAFATLMRAGGVPARVVTGYWGGEWNPFGHYLLIRQSDAHAWTEVWLQGQGWVRVDPTAVISAASMTESFDGLIPAAERNGRHMALWLVGSVQAWQALNAWWQDQVVSFNFYKQLDLIGKLGLGDQQWHALVWVLALGGSLWLGLVAWSLRPRLFGHGADSLARTWRLLEHKLGASVPPRAAHEGPLGYAERVSRQRPELATSVHLLARRFAQLRYGPQASASELEQFRRAVRRWRPRRPAQARPEPGGRST